MSMRISNLGIRNENGIKRVHATVNWEDADRLPLTLFVDVEERYADKLWPDPNAFLIVCVLPAWRFGEQRVWIEGSICPVLAHNLQTVFGVIKSWNPEEFGDPPQIEPSLGLEVLKPFGQQSLSLFSGGIDSLSILRWNKLYIPSDHPGSIHGVVSIAFDEDEVMSLTRYDLKTRGRRLAVQAAIDDAEVDHVNVRTNLWWLVDDGYFFDKKWQGAVLCSVATFFSRHFLKGYIASSVYGVSPPEPWAWGSHPQLEPNFSSAYIDCVHQGLFMSRISKTSLVAEWPAGLHSIRVCQNDSSGTNNCGTCEKCIETMTALLALGKLKGCQAFPRDYVDADLVLTIDQWKMLDGHDYLFQYFQSLIPLLTDQGRDDLVDALHHVLLQYQLRKAKETEIVQYRMPYENLARRGGCI